MSDLEREVETNPYLVPYETLLNGFKKMKRERDEARAKQDALANIGRDLIAASHAASVGDNPPWHDAINRLRETLAGLEEA